MANMTFKANLMPDNTTAQRELGSSDAKWKINGYFPVVSVTVTGGGNAVTSITNTDGQVTATKGTTFSTTDTKNTAGSTDTSSKIFLVGTTSQTANAQTYSDNQVYATNGQLDANKLRVAEHVTLQYNTTTNALDFVFV